MDICRSDRSEVFLDCVLHLISGRRTELAVADERKIEGRANLDPANVRQLLAHPDDPDYGTKLFAALLPEADPVTSAYRTARYRAEHDGLRLRLCLEIRRDAGAHLHRLRWERLEDPRRRGEPPLSCQDGIVLARSVGTWQRVELPQLTRPRLLVAVSAPKLPAGGDLTPIDRAEVHRSFERVLERFAGQVELEFLSGALTRAQLGERLLDKSRPVHLLHLHAHGGIDSRKSQAVVVLENEDGTPDFVDEEEFAELLPSRGRPLLVTLMACYSARITGDDGYFGLARTLLGIGIPAVLAMESTVGMDSALELCGLFYPQLLRTGRIDAAVNRARHLLQQRRPESDDWSDAILFLGRRDGRVWEHRPEYSPTWPPYAEVLSQIQVGRLVPILGPRINSGLLPLPSDMVRQRAGGTDDGSDMGWSTASLAQIWENEGGPKTPHREVWRALRQSLHGRNGEAAEGMWLSMVEAAEQFLRDKISSGEHGIHSLLAELTLPLYLTTNYDTLLSAALRWCGHRPCTVAYPMSYVRSTHDWHEYMDLTGTIAEPLVFHFFGYESAEQLVLTESEHFDFLGHFAGSREQGRLPEFIRRRLADSNLLFLGFDIRDLGCRSILWRLLERVRSRKRTAVLQVAPSLRCMAGRWLDTFHSRWRDELNLEICFAEAQDVLRHLGRRSKQTNVVDSW